MAIKTIHERMRSEQGMLQDSNLYYFMEYAGCSDKRRAEDFCFSMLSRNGLAPGFYCGSELHIFYQIYILMGRSAARSNAIQQPAFPQSSKIYFICSNWRKHAPGTL
jgi:hypothetical protein